MAKCLAYTQCALYLLAYEEYYPSSSQAKILYGIPNTHKNNVPLSQSFPPQTIISIRLPKFFVPLLRPVSSDMYTLTDSFPLVKGLLNLNFESRQ